ncbi:aldose epimerase family protein [Xylophilus sp.]|uniref:aldose epimerase family protein n=1 Tax=Xylophilus sp. TaxID=2653893 RepID=UPI0013BB2750|nr:hypothetical protein [Xylophilus sp.]KAF1049368.1 MAG: putative protein YphB [Xylophilus sp.]
MTTFVSLNAGGATARIAPDWGARITACTLEDAHGARQAVLHPYPESEAHRPDHWGKGGLYPLVPFSGRIRDARLRRPDGDRTLVPHPGDAHALHGIAQRRPWEVVSATDRRAVLQYRHAPDAHWPWAFDAGMVVQLEPHQLRVDISLTNRSEEPMPAGIGLHPYLPGAMPLHIAYDAAAAWPTDADFLALPTPPAEAIHTHGLGGSDFAGRDCTVFHPRWQQRATVQGITGTAIDLRAEGALDQLIVHRPPDGPYVCLEPVSHMPDAFNLHDVPGTGTRELRPQGRLAGGLVLSI